MTTIRKADVHKANVKGTVYLLHFSRPYGHCRHYIGFTERTIEKRTHEHLNGYGSALTNAAEEVGITFDVARTWEDVDQSVEFLLKSWADGPALCPICSGPSAYNRGAYDVQA